MAAQPMALGLQGQEISAHRTQVAQAAQVAQVSQVDQVARAARAAGPVLTEVPDCRETH